MLDNLRVAVEDYLDEVVDWWPLGPLERLRKEQHTKLRWEYGGEDMSIILNQSETEEFRTNQIQAQGESHRMNILPIAQPRSYQSNDTQAPSKIMARKPFWKRWIQHISQVSNAGKPNPPGPGTSTGTTQMEAYLCADKCWTTIKGTRMRTVTAVDNMQSDFDFFYEARNLLSQAEGNWLQRNLSWWSHTSVAFSRDTYQYTPILDMGIDIQLRICATILLRGVANPELGRGRRQLLDSMPKLLAPPGLNKKQFSGGWGFHARQGLCMRKTMGWIGAVLAFGIAFVPYWLCAIDELDVQTALAPASFLATVLGVGLAMLAIAQTR
ncbi:basic-leucine zipper transcription factor DNA binding nucleus regulation of transcription [Diaporthe eres]|nr:basic-leucine zipper transcription factor DNA binding nucleus regulation of transcription [Diaporthe eres]